MLQDGFSAVIYKNLVAFFYLFLTVVLVIALVASSQIADSTDPGKWNSSLHENSTEDLSLGSIGNLARTRGNIGLDRSGRPKPQW